MASNLRPGLNRGLGEQGGGQRQKDALQQLQHEEVQGPGKGNCRRHRRWAVHRRRQEQDGGGPDGEQQRVDLWGWCSGMEGGTGFRGCSAPAAHPYAWPNPWQTPVPECAFGWARGRGQVGVRGPERGAKGCGGRAGIAPRNRWGVGRPQGVWGLGMDLARGPGPWGGGAGGSVSTVGPTASPAATAAARGLYGGSGASA